MKIDNNLNWEDPGISIEDDQWCLDLYQGHVELHYESDETGHVWVRFPIELLETAIRAYQAEDLRRGWGRE